MTRVRPSAGKTLHLQVPDLADLEPAAHYFFSAMGSEARSRAPIWDRCLNERSTNCVEIIEWTRASLKVRLQDGTESEVALNDDVALRELMLRSPSAYLDISGLPHHVWAPLLRAGFATLSTLRVVYAEPEKYRRHPSPTSRSEFDLSEGFLGIEPIPGFAKLRGPDDETAAVLVALLGFEGKRATRVALELDPVPPVFAVVGVPGFRIEYPQVTHASNAEFLHEHRVFARIRHAPASCPFGAFDALVDIQRDTGGKYMYLAPIGTKPHSLGAICFALKNPASTEVMYDHPLRKPGRTDGLGPVHIYTLKPSHVAP